MKCRKCGWEMTEQARFCPHCGAPVELAESAESPEFPESPEGMSRGMPDMDSNSVSDMNHNNRKKGKNKKRNTVLIVLLILCALVIAAIIGVLLYTGTNSYQISRKLSLGDRYLEEKDYERAVAAYEEAVEIDSKSVDAYLGLAAAHSEYAQDLTQKAENAQESADAKNYAVYIEQARTEVTYSEESYSTVEILIQEQESELSEDKKQTVEEKADSVQRQNEETAEKVDAMPDSIDPDDEAEEDDEPVEEADKGPMYQAYLDVLEGWETEILRYEGWIDYTYDYYPAYPAKKKEIALYDLDGDGMEELIFLEGETTDNGSDWGLGYLYIYTYKDGEAVEIYRDIARTNAGGGSTFIIAMQNDSDSFMIINSYADEFLYVYLHYCSLKGGAVSVNSWRMIGIDDQYTYGMGEPYGLAGEGEGNFDGFKAIGNSMPGQQVSLDTVEQNRQEIQAQIGQVLLRDYPYDSSESVYDGYIEFSGEPDNPMNLQEARAYLRDLIEQYGGSDSETEDTSGVSDSEWKQAYLEHIREYQSTAGESAEYVSYKLFDLNGDDIPELLIVGPSTAAGMEICTYAGGEVYSTTIAMGSLYCHPGSSLCLNRQVRMGGEVDFVYNKVRDGGFAVLAEGSGTVVEGENDYDDPVLTDCKFNGNSVSYEEYRENLKELVPLDGATNVAQDAYDFTTLEEELENY